MPAGLTSTLSCFRFRPANPPCFLGNAALESLPVGVAASTGEACLEFLVRLPILDSLRGSWRRSASTLSSPTHSSRRLLTKGKRKFQVQNLDWNEFESKMVWNGSTASNVQQLTVEVVDVKFPLVINFALGYDFSPCC